MTGRTHKMFTGRFDSSWYALCFFFFSKPSHIRAFSTGIFGCDGFKILIRLVDSCHPQRCQSLNVSLGARRSTSARCNSTPFVLFSTVLRWTLPNDVRIRFINVKSCAGSEETVGTPLMSGQARFEMT